MKPIEFSKNFEKAYKTRISKNQKLKAKYELCYRLFLAGERGYPLNDHSLTGLMAGKRAFSITGDVRVIYIETEQAIIFLDIGSHNQVYN